MAGSAATRDATAASVALQLAALLRDRQRCNSRRCCETGNALQLAATAIADNAATRDAAAMASSVLLAGQRCVATFLFFLFFFRQPQEGNRKRKGGRAFETCSKISTLLVGRNVIRKRPPVPTQAPSGGNNTNALRLRQEQHQH